MDFLTLIRIYMGIWQSAIVQISRIPIVAGAASSNLWIMIVAMLIFDVMIFRIVKVGS